MPPTATAVTAARQRAATVFRGEVPAKHVRRAVALTLPFLATTFGACSGPQSALDPAGLEASRLATLFWWMLIGSGIVWAAVLYLGLRATKHRPDRDTARQARLLVIGGGVALPTVVLTVLLIVGLAELPDYLEPPPRDALRIRVIGEQYWWRVEYPQSGDAPVTLANEIRLPVGEPVEFELLSPDVIHSFWIPALGGKMDMIPGRRNRLRLTAGRTGEFRGACAEFCGTSHAWMAFPVVVMERAEFDAWLEQQRSPAASPAPAVHGGQAAFLANGCGACHTVRGSPADGVVGPDLTHVGSRLSLGAGVLGNEIDDFVRWIAETDRVKPGVLMPHFGMLPQDELRALAAYLDSLQ